MPWSIKVSPAKFAILRPFIEFGFVRIYLIPLPEGRPIFPRNDLHVLYNNNTLYFVYTFYVHSNAFTVIIIIIIKGLTEKLNYLLLLPLTKKMV